MTTIRDELNQIESREDLETFADRHSLDELLELVGDLFGELLDSTEQTAVEDEHRSTESQSTEVQSHD